MEYRVDNHVQNYYMSVEKTFPKRFRTASFDITANTIFTPIDIKMPDGKTYWLNKQEMDKLNELHIELSDIEAYWYVAGSITPFGPQDKEAGSTMDGYETHLILKDK